MKICVYTVLLGGYDALLEQPVARDSDADFICFTDAADLRSDTWDLQPVTPFLPQDIHRSSREFKILGHPRLDEYDVTVCVDASVLLRSRPETIVSELLRDEVDMALLTHSFRETVLDEFDEVVRLNYDDRARVYEQLTDYAVYHPDALSAKPLWGGMLVRRRNERVSTAMRVWFDQVLRYSRRDQLSLPYALQNSGLAFRAVELDNFASELHEWPVLAARRVALGKVGPLSSGPLVADIRRARRRIIELESDLRAMDHDGFGALNEEIGRLRDQIGQGTAERARLESSLEAVRRRDWEREGLVARAHSVRGAARNLADALNQKLRRRRPPAAG